MYATDLYVRTLSMPIDSNCRYAMVPVESCVSVWSMVMAISSPAFILPDTRCAEMIFSAKFMPVLPGVRPSSRGRSRLCRLPFILQRIAQKVKYLLVVSAELWYT